VKSSSDTGSVPSTDDEVTGRENVCEGENVHCKAAERAHEIDAPTRSLIDGRVLLGTISPCTTCHTLDSNAPRRAQTRRTPHRNRGCTLDIDTDPAG